MSYIGDLGGLLCGLGTVGLCWISYKQLSGINKSLDTQNIALEAQNLAIGLELEYRIFEASEKITQINAEIQVVGSNNKTKAEALRDQIKAAHEIWYNLFDRLCFLILKRALDEERYRTEYRETLSSILQHDKFKFFGSGSKYRNMIDLHNAWAKK